MPIDVTTLREDLDNHSREIVDKSEEREEYKREQKTKQEAYQKEAQAFETIQTELLNLVTNSESDALKLSQLLLEYPKMQVRLDCVNTIRGSKNMMQTWLYILQHQSRADV